MVALYHTMYLGRRIFFGVGGGINKTCYLSIAQADPVIGVGEIGLLHVVETGVVEKESMGEVVGYLK